MTSAAATAESPLLLVDKAEYAASEADGPRPTVGPVELEVAQGEFLSVVGPHGCGKTTLLKMLAGLLPPTSGTIMMSGKDAKLMKRDVGLVFRRPVLMGWRSVLDNILLQAELLGLDPVSHRDRALRMLAWLGLSAFERQRPGELPPGMAQGVAVCRALVHSPSLLLMDEPFRALDAMTMEQVSFGLQRLWMETKTAVVMTTSNIQEAVLLSDRVAVLSQAPARVLRIFPIELPRPRRMDKDTTPRIVDYCNRIRILLQAEGVVP